MKRIHLTMPHGGRCWRAILGASVIGAMVWVSAQPAAAGCTLTTPASPSKLIGGTKPTGSGILKIGWAGIYPNALPQPAFSTWNPYVNGATVIALVDGTSSILYPSTAVPIFLPPIKWNTAACANLLASRRCGWSQPSPTKWRWRGGALSPHPEVKALQLQVLQPGSPTEAVKVKIGIQRSGMQLPALASPTLALPLDVLVDPDGLGDDCVSGGFSSSSQCVQLIATLGVTATVKCHNP